MSLVDLFMSTSYIVMPRAFIKALGIKETLLLSELVSEYRYFEESDQLTDDGLFYCSIDKLTDKTGLSRHEQDTAIANLKEKGVLKVNVQGMPAKRYFKINEEDLKTLLQTSLSESDKQDCRKPACNNNKYNNNKPTNIVSKDTIYSKAEQTHTYSKNDFLGSRNVEKKPKRGNLYSKCMDEIERYVGSNHNVSLYSTLVQYLNLRLAMKDKPIYNVNQWIAILQKLDDIVAEDPKTDVEKVVKQSIERGWAAFFPINKNTKQKRDVFNEFGEVTCKKSTGEDDTDVEY